MKAYQDDRLGASAFSPITMAYGFAHFGKSLFWYASEILFAYFLTEVSGLGPSVMGFILAAGFLCGALADLVGGAVLRYELSTPANASRLQLLGAILSAGSLILLFFTSSVPDKERVVYALGTGLGFRIAYTLYDLPQNTLISLATNDEDSRSRVSATRLFFSGVASLVISASLGPLLTKQIAINLTSRYLFLAIALSIVALSSSIMLWKQMSSAGDQAPSQIVSKKESIENTLSLLPEGVWFFVAMMFIISGTASSFGKIEPYYTTYLLKSPFWGAIVTMAASIGTAISQPLWTHLAFRLNRSAMLYLSTASLIISIIIFWMVARHPVPAMFCALCFGVSSGGLGIALWSAFGDIVAEKGARMAGISYGLLTAAVKTSLAISGIALGAALNQLDYRSTGSQYLTVLMCLPLITGCLAILLLIRLWSSRRGKSSSKERLL